MSTLPTIKTERLLLDAFDPSSDAEQTERLVSVYEVARFTLNIPHPYPPGHIFKWFAKVEAERARGDSVVFAIRLPDRTVVGAVGLRLERPHDRGELGYWLGQPFWGHGYATEAARAALAFGFESLDLHKIEANYDPANIASRRVLQKLGMTAEGVRRDHVKRDGVYSDSATYGMLRSEFEVSKRIVADRP